jgi:hypothetical protein
MVILAAPAYVGTAAEKEWTMRKKIAFSVAGLIAALTVGGVAHHASGHRAPSPAVAAVAPGTIHTNGGFEWG